MSTQCPINATTVDTFGQYNQAAKHLIAAYRFGTARVMSGAGERYEQFVGGRSLLSDDVKQRLIDAEQKVGNAVLGVVSRVADKADSLVDSLAQRAVAGVETLDEKTAWSRDVSVINALRQLNLPVAKVSLKLAEGVADVSRRLSERVAGQPDVVAETVQTVKAGVKKARAGAKRVQRAVRARA
ncbi:hypothetical protein [Aquabacterium sp.]|uniref:hypothetical protein n=1 Tax=Aquabacterium sp. TaxID=1872578 RepID=UPI002BFC9298|nr:hypothetical protein [Aquabacterium sp.]HSW04011.1 hypothetical protein [Aquabacterium sp.]